MKLAVYGKGLAVPMTSWIMLTASLNVTFTRKKMHSCSKYIRGISLFVFKKYPWYIKRYISYVLLHRHSVSWKMKNANLSVGRRFYVGRTVPVVPLEPGRWRSFGRKKTGYRWPVGMVSRDNRCCSGDILHNLKMEWTLVIISTYICYTND